MFWLVSQMLGWLILTTIAGGLIGWSLHCRKCAHETEGLRKSLEKAYANKHIEPEELRVSGGIGHSQSTTKPYVSIVDEKHSDLLKQLSAEREEVAGLKAKLSLAGATGQQDISYNYAGLTAFSGSRDISEKDGEIRWRNRYLESRVRFLESKVSDLEVAPATTSTENEKNIEPDTSAVLPSALDLIHDAEDLPEDLLAEDVVRSFASEEGLNTDRLHAQIPSESSNVVNEAQSALTSGSPKAVEQSFVSETAKNSSQPILADDDISAVDVQSIIWRNRYLEGRVQYLEEDRKSDGSNELGALDVKSSIEKNSEVFSNELNSAGLSAIQSSDSSYQEDKEQLDRLRWRTRYLEGRIRFLEEEAITKDLELEKLKVIPKSFENSNGLDSRSSSWERANWRNTYLSEKLRYQSSNVSAAGKDSDELANTTLVDPANTKLNGERVNWREAYLAERIRYGQEKLEIEKTKTPYVRELVTDIGMDRLRWRSRYLQEKINELERDTALVSSKMISDVNEGIEETVAPVPPVIKEKVRVQAFSSEKETELVRLRWRESYLRTLQKLRERNEEDLSRETSDQSENENLQANNNSFDQAYSEELEADIQRLEWRNRFLNGRVKYLEENLSSSQTEIKSLQEIKAASIGEQAQYGDESDTTKLKWRNSYLLGRIGYLEEGRSDEEQSFVTTESEERPGDALDNLEELSELRETRMNEKTEETENSAYSSRSSNSKSSSLSSSSRSGSRYSYENGERTSKRKRRSRKNTRRSTEQSVERTSESKVVTAESFQESFRKSEYFVEGEASTGRPAYLTQPLLGEHDDLREIAGVGPKIERILHDLGIYHFYQIAAWTRREVEWVDNYLTFKGRIDRENWIEQSKKLARGEETDGQRKYRAGKHV